MRKSSVSELKASGSMQRTGRRALRCTAVAALGFLIFVVLPSIPKVRAILSVPLVVHNPAARGDACYVLDGGGSLTERLDAAADLIQMRRVSTLFLMDDFDRGPYSFKAHTSWTRGCWAADYLAWRGVPAATVRWIPREESPFGTLSEARSVAKRLPAEVRALVLVSSAPHMRRAVLAFERALPATVQMVPYAATDFENGYELYHPIWLEYLKLLLYEVIC